MSRRKIASSFSVSLTIFFKKNKYSIYKKMANYRRKKKKGHFPHIFGAFLKSARLGLQEKGFDF